MSALVLVLASALLHAAWNLCVKRHEDPGAAMAAVASLSALASGGAALAEWTAGAGAPFPTSRALELAILCGLCETVYFLGLARALKAGALGTSYVVVRGGSVLAVWPLAFVVQGELPTALQAAGIAALVLGLTQLYPRAAGSARAAYGWAALAAVATAANHVAYKAALGAGARAWAVFALAMLIASPATIAMMGPGGEGSATPLARYVAAFRRRPALVLIAGTLCAGSFGLALDAMRTAGAAWVGTLRNTSVALAPALGWLFLGERPGRRALAGFALVAAAVVLLSAAN